jgi:hypothetical protein
VLTPRFNGPAVATTQLPEAKTGEEYGFQLSAESGTAPYKWLPVEIQYLDTIFTAPFPTSYHNKILPDMVNTNKITVALPFDFPYQGKTYHQMTVTTDGGLLLTKNYVWVPYMIQLKEMLGQNTAIYPFYSTEFQYIESTDGIYYDVQDTAVTVYWNASLVLNSQISDVNFAARLFPNGNIEFYYGDFPNNTTKAWLIGMTGGSKAKSYFPALNATGVTNGLNVRFRSPALPEDFALTTDGFLSCKPLEAYKKWTIPVCVEDYQGLQTRRDLTLSTMTSNTDQTHLTDPEIQIYPNPVTDQSYVYIENGFNGNIDLKIFDLNGKIVVTGKHFMHAGKSIIPLELSSNMAPGIYILQLTGAVQYKAKINLNVPVR